MSFLEDPQIKKASLLLEYIKTRNVKLKQEVIDIIQNAGPATFKTKIFSSAPFKTESDAKSAVVEVGKSVSQMRLTNSVFGNASILFGDRLFISAAGSKLENLENEIAECDLEGNSLNGLVPSSELYTHLKIVKETSAKCVLHAHPFFTVAASMIKGIGDYLFGVPIVGGEVGRGENGIVRTVPPLFADFNIVIVYGHGVFSADAFDFNNPFRGVQYLEKLSKKRIIEKYLGFQSNIM